ncbi:SDR family NAD(P)-dependent oxidoreductase [Paractinoplanes lichenicola]|uniref:SDR family oxidoreductase n=1 Tax=Paractinoplanes lichenicola TaxID=2802976 RepID=A0ABS1VT04_9ACTN|nr:SDR family oxidoreductase [Actinoplanes lichenicola]MBL7257595.1 SDR family oxidoreductase [Actinoplanes lichenicola]
MSTRRAVVAGAGGGLGRATVVALREAGFEVVAVDRSAGKVGDLAAEVADVTDPAAAKPLIDRIVARFGVPDVLVNTVGAHALGDFMSVTPESLAALMSVNVGPALWLTQAVAPHMIGRGEGAIVHVGARAGIEPAAGSAAYGSTKAALAHLGRVLDLELRPQGIRVAVVLPSLIATAANKAVLPPQLLAHAAAPERVAELIVSTVTGEPAPAGEFLVPVEEKV